MAGNASIINILEAGIKAGSFREQSIANNISNINTPEFKRSGVKFDDALASAMDTPGGMKTKDLRAVEMELFQPSNTPVKSNGNDVDISIEMGGLIKNTVKQKAYLKMLGKMYSQMADAMKSTT